MLLASYDAIVMACGATQWRDLPVPGRELQGIYQAMEYLPPATKVQLGDMAHSPIDVQGKHVVIIGGGDTGADCLGTAHRQGAASVTQLEIMPRPPEERGANNPWPQFAMVYKVTTAHEEGGDRLYSVNTERFLDDGNGRVRALLIHEVTMVDGRFQKVEGTDRELPADFVFLAQRINDVLLDSSRLIFQNEYRLYPGKRYVEITTTITNGGTSIVQFPADAVNSLIADA